MRKSNPPNMYNKITALLVMAVMTFTFALGASSIAIINYDRAPFGANPALGRWTGTWAEQRSTTSATAGFNNTGVTGNITNGTGVAPALNSIWQAADHTPADPGHPGNWNYTFVTERSDSQFGPWGNQLPTTRNNQPGSPPDGWYGRIISGPTQRTEFSPCFGVGMEAFACNRCWLSGVCQYMGMDCDWVLAPRCSSCSAPLSVGARCPGFQGATYWTRQRVTAYNVVHPFIAPREQFWTRRVIASANQTMVSISAVSANTTMGTVNNPTNQSVALGFGTATFTATPTANHHFVRWEFVTAGGATINSPNNPTTTVTAGTANSQIRAVFAVSTVTRTFQAGTAPGATGGNLTQVVTIGVDTALSTDFTRFTRPGFHYTSWTLDSAGGGTSITTHTTTAATTFFPFWRANVGTIIFDPGGYATAPPPIYEVSTGDAWTAITIPQSYYRRFWHVFVGFFTEPDGGYQVLQADGGVLPDAPPLIMPTHGGTLTLYAQWINTLPELGDGLVELVAEAHMRNITRTNFAPGTTGDAQWLEFQIALHNAENLIRFVPDRTPVQIRPVADRLRSILEVAG